MENRTIAEVITELREERGWSKNQLAKILNVSKTSITMWEAGTRRPNRNMSKKICDIFAVDLNYLNGTSSVRNSKNDEASDLIQIPIYELSDITDELPADKQISKIYVPAFTLRNNTSYFATVISDNSMKNYDLHIGDIAIFEIPAENVTRGYDIVCAFVNNKTAIRILVNDGHGQLTLRTNNELYPDEICENEPVVKGILAGCFHGRQIQ